MLARSHQQPSSKSCPNRTSLFRLWAEPSTNSPTEPRHHWSLRKSWTPLQSLKHKLIILSPIVIITPPSTIATRTEQPPPITQPTFTGSGQLLTQGDCASTSYTLVSAGDVVYYAAFIGCMADRPECCPWSVALDNPIATGGGGIHEGNRVAGGAGRLPIPANGVQALLAKCPDDYYSVSSQGMCCPT